jgi:hypothetical protein
MRVIENKNMEELEDLYKNMEFLRYVKKALSVSPFNKEGGMELFKNLSKNGFLQELRDIYRLDGNSNNNLK